MNLERGAASLLDALLGGREIKYGELERGETPLPKTSPSPAERLARRGGQRG